MENSKIKLRTEVVKQAQIEGQVINACREISGRLRETFDAIGIIPTDEILRDCFIGSADEVSKQFYEKLNGELKAVTIPAIRAGFEKSAVESLKNFNTVRAEIIGKYGDEVFKYITFEKGTAIFSDESKQQLADDCGVYISTPEEIELYNLHLAACEALNKMYKGYGSPSWNQHFEFENGKFIPNPLVQYHAVLFKINVTNSINSK